jgi:hypothetical protein
MDDENGGTTFKAKGIFEVEVEMFASEEQITKLKAGDPETVAEFQLFIAENAQDILALGDTPFDVSECEYEALKGKGFEPEKSSTE